MPDASAAAAGRTLKTHCCRIACSLAARLPPPTSCDSCSGSPRACSSFSPTSLVINSRPCSPKSCTHGAHTTSERHSTCQGAAMVTSLYVGTAVRHCMPQTWLGVRTMCTASTTGCRRPCWVPPPPPHPYPRLRDAPAASAPWTCVLGSSQQAQLSQPTGRHACMPLQGLMYSGSTTLQLPC